MFTIRALCQAGSPACFTVNMEMVTSRAAPLLLPWSCSWWNPIPRSLVAFSDPEKWAFSLEVTVPFHWVHWCVKIHLVKTPNLRACKTSPISAALVMPLTIHKIPLDWFTSLFFWCFLPSWCFDCSEKYRESCKTKLDLSGGRKESGVVSITLRWLQLVNLLTLLSRFCIELLHTLFHLSGNWTLQVNEEGTGKTGNSWFKVLQLLLKGMWVPLGSWLRFSHIYQ